MKSGRSLSAFEWPDFSKVGTICAFLEGAPSHQRQTHRIKINKNVQRNRLRGGSVNTGNIRGFAMKLRNKLLYYYLKYLV